MHSVKVVIDILKYTDEPQYVGSKSLEYDVGVSIHNSGNGKCYYPKRRGSMGHVGMRRFVITNV